MTLNIYCIYIIKNRYCQEKFFLMMILNKHFIFFKENVGKIYDLKIIFIMIKISNYFLISLLDNE